MAPKWPSTYTDNKFWIELNFFLVLSAYIIGATCVTVAIAFLVWFALRVL